MNRKMNSVSFFIPVAISLLQLVNYGECTLPRLPDSLSSKPEFNKFLVDQDRIVGGSAAAAGQFPYQVSMQRLSSDGSKKHFCGACIINDRYIATAAHCVSGSGDVSKISARIGTNSIADSSGTSMKLLSCKRYSGYNSGTVQGDIAMCETAEKIVMGPYVKAVALPYSKEECNNGSKLIVTGWGTTSEGGSISKSLQQVAVPFVSDEQCRVSYGAGEISDDMICAGETDKDSCQGDSGGPMVAVNPDGTIVLVGIVSWGYGCARPGYPGVYTQVSHHIDYIKSTCESDPNSSALTFISLASNQN